MKKLLLICLLTGCNLILSCAEQKLEVQRLVYPEDVQASQAICAIQEATQINMQSKNLNLKVALLVKDPANQQLQDEVLQAFELLLQEHRNLYHTIMICDQLSEAQKLHFFFVNHTKFSSYAQNSVEIIREANSNLSDEHVQLLADIHRECFHRIINLIETYIKILKETEKLIVNCYKA